MIELQGVVFHPEGMKVLDGVDLKIQNGEVFVIMGASGAGKSTILRIMNGLTMPDSGKVLVDGQDISGFSESQLVPIRQRVGMVFQSAALFDSLSVADNVGFALRAEKKRNRESYRQKIRETLSIVGLDGIEDRMPAELSGGMKKRVGLARTIAMKPDVLLYDEPTAGLDPITSKRILDLIADLKKRLRVTSVMVTHDVPGAFAVADRVGLLVEGKIVFEGSVEAMQASQDPLVRGFITGEGITG